MSGDVPGSLFVPGSSGDPIRGPGGILDLPLGKMIIHIVVRLQDPPYTTVRLENTVQACLQGGVQSSIRNTDIKLDKVHEVFQHSLEEQLPGLGLKFSYGNLFYYRDGVKVPIRRQGDFQNAIQRLFNANKIPPMNNILVFNFAPESINEKSNRQARERAQANIAEKTRTERASTATNQTPINQRGGSSATGPELRGSFPRGGNRAGAHGVGSQRGGLSEGSTAVSSSRGRGTARAGAQRGSSSRETQTTGPSTRTPASLDQLRDAGSRQRPASSSNKKPGISSSSEEPKPPKSLRPKRLSILSTAIQSIKSPILSSGKPTARPRTGTFRISGVFGKRTETAEETEERYDKMVGVVSVEAFQRGGTDDYVPMPTKNQLTKGTKSDDNSGDEDSEDEETAGDQATEEFKETVEDKAAKMLKSLLSLKELKQIRSPSGTVEGVDYEGFDQWAQCSLMFFIDGRKQGIADMIKIAGLKSPIYQYQALAVYWQMYTSRTVGGGFVADEMGLGKTLTFLAYIVVERQLSVLWTEVNRSRQLNDGKHLQINQHKHNDKCPTIRKLGWIGCPCASSNPASKMAPKPGARLAIVPPGLVSSWRQEWRARIDLSENTLNMRLLIAHQSTLTGAPEIIEDAYKSVNSSRLIAIRKRDKDGCVYIEAKPDQDKFLVLSTKDSFPSWVKGQYEFKADKVREVGKDENGRMTKNTAVLNVIFGIAAADECHGDYQKNKGRSKILAGLPGQPYCWGYSGSPFPQTPRGLEGILWVIESHATKTHPFKRGTAWEELDSKMGKFNSKNFDHICTQFENYTKSSKSQQSVEEISDQIEPFLTTFMIRRLADSMWFRHPLVQLKPHIHQDILIKHDNKYDSLISVFNVLSGQAIAKRLETLQHTWDHDRNSRNGRPRPERITFNTQSRLSEMSRMMADFPYLAKMARDPLYLGLSTKELIPFRRHEKSKQVNPYFRNLKELVESSPKCLWLRRFIKWLLTGVNHEGKELKLVIVSKFNPVLFIIKMFIEQHFPDKVGRVGIIYPGLKPRENADIQDAFMDKDDGNGKRIRKENYQFLLGPTDLIGQGLQLTRACHIVLFEPDSQHHLEKQVYARVNRIGQKNPYSYSYRLTDGNNDAEFAIIDRQISRQEFPGRFLKKEEAALLGDKIQTATHTPRNKQPESIAEEQHDKSEPSPQPEYHPEHSEQPQHQDPPPQAYQAYRIPEGDWPLPPDPLTKIPLTKLELEVFRQEEILEAMLLAGEKEINKAVEMEALATDEDSRTPTDPDLTRRQPNAQSLIDDTILSGDIGYVQGGEYWDSRGNRFYLDDNNHWVPVLLYDTTGAEIVSPESASTTPAPRHVVHPLRPDRPDPPTAPTNPSRSARASRLSKFRKSLRGN